MKNDSIFTRLRRTLSLALTALIAATMMACEGDDKMLTELPKPDDGNGNGTTEITPDKGITLYGLVSDKEGNPLEGVVVSDGYSVVASDKKGVYQIVRDPNAKHVFISVPSGYEIPAQANFGSYQGAYQAANSVTGSSSKPYRADFTLTKLTQSDKRFLLFGLGDPQPDNSDHIQRFRTEAVPDVKKISAKYSIPQVGIALGDILGKGDAQTFTSMKRAFGETGVPFFTTIGNHDKSSVDYTGDTYRDVLGPRWYSFNRGDVHFIAMDNIIFTGTEYTGGFTDEQVAWLEKDLSFVPTDKMVILYYHIPLRDNSDHIQRFRTEAVPDVKKISAKYSIPQVGIALGDILGKGDAQTFTSMKRAFGETGVPFFTTIGNHDKSSVDYTGDTYRDVLGPRWYSFNRGDVHFIAMDNIIFTGTEYTGGFTDEQVAWLEKDLSFVPTDKMVILYYHIPLRDNTGYLNRKKVLDMISRYKNPILMCAHTHYFQPYHMRSHKLFERIHGGTCGYFWRSTCGGDGTPNGFMVYEIDGTKIIDTYFKASQRADDYQIRLYRGNAEFAGPYATYKYDVGADVVVANVFTSGMDGTTWKVELSEDGGKTWSVMTEMSQSYGDRWIRGYHIGVEKHPVESGTSPCYHQYQCKLKNPEATGIVVRATDSFNHAYTQTRFNESNDFTEAEGY